MSGLGDRRSLNSKNIDERYNAICEAASSRSLLSLGIACFTQKPKKKPTSKIRLKCVVFNVLTFCTKDFVVEPKSLEFLLQHGFDFNQQFSKGVPYSPESDRNYSKKNTTSDSIFSIRCVFNQMICARKPVVLHNSFIDLIFLYANLYGPTPGNMHTFLADLVEMFPAGIYDTKYVADYCVHTPSSFLEYVFRKCQRDLQAPSHCSRLSVRFSKLPDFACKFVFSAFYPATEGRSPSSTIDVALCNEFKFHGCCHKASCSKSHDVDLILDAEEIKQRKKRDKRKRRLANEIENDDLNLHREEGHVNSIEQELLKSLLKKRKAIELTNEEEQSKKKTTSSCVTFEEKVSNGLEKKKEIYLCSGNKLANGEVTIFNGDISTNQKCIVGVHRAGFDAFMTGYSLAVLSLKYANWTGNETNYYVEEFKNKIPLSGKDYPLLVQASSYVKTSAFHVEHFKKIIDTARTQSS